VEVDDPGIDFAGVWAREPFALGVQNLDQSLRASTFGLVVERLWLSCGDRVELGERVDLIAIVAFRRRYSIAVVQVWAHARETSAQLGQLGDKFAVLFLEDAHAIQCFVAQVIEMDRDVANRTTLESPSSTPCRRAWRLSEPVTSLSASVCATAWADRENVDHPLGILTIEDHPPLTDT
jgi:hypothetical protein